MTFIDLHDYWKINFLLEFRSFLNNFLVSLTNSQDARLRRIDNSSKAGDSHHTQIGNTESTTLGIILNILNYDEFIWFQSILLCFINKLLYLQRDFIEPLLIGSRNDWSNQTVSGINSD
jgi:hypothetical protein